MIHRHKAALPFGAQRFLAIFEGTQGGFAVGTSIIVALYAAGLEVRVLLLTAILTIIVSGFNAASMKYASEHYLDELDGREKRSRFRQYFLPAFLEFLLYSGISLLVVLPLLFISLPLAVLLCSVVTIAVLFAVGYLKGHLLRMKPVRDGIEAAVLGIGIILLGLMSGWVLGSL